MSPAACIAAPLPPALFLTELRRQCTQLFNCEGNPLRAARSIERTVTAILPQRLPSCCCGICIFVVPETRNQRSAAGRIAVTVRPIARARLGRASRAARAIGRTVSSIRGNDRRSRSDRFAPHHRGMDSGSAAPSGMTTFRGPLRRTAAHNYHERPACSSSTQVACILFWKASRSFALAMTMSFRMTAVRATMGFLPSLIRRS